MTHFWCKGCEQCVDKKLDGLEMQEGEMYCAFCVKEIKKDKTE